MIKVVMLDDEATQSCEDCADDRSISPILSRIFENADQRLAVRFGPIQPCPSRVIHATAQHNPHGFQKCWAINLRDAARLSKIESSMQTTFLRLREAPMRSLVILLVCSCAVAARADLLVYEPFNYDAVGTSVEGKTAATGQTWLSAYAATAPNAINVIGGNLSVPSALQPAVGNAAEIDGSGNGAGKAIRLPFGGSNGVAQDAGGTIYYSLSLRIDALTGSNVTTGGFFLGLNNGAAASTANPTAAGARLQGRIDPSDGTRYNLGIFRNVNAAAAATSWSGPLTVGDTLFLVGSYESVAGTQNDIARLWINPAASILGDSAFSPLTTPPTLIDNSTGTGTDLGIFSILLRQSPAPHLTLDEVRVGTDWASVTAIPEASPLIALMLVSAPFFAVRAKAWKLLGT
jgi:hypothetical protein